MKKNLEGKTLIGEYVGNHMYQHIVGYEKETIIFYTIVDNNKAEITSLLPEESS
jgi:hypothetical protein